jgi:hypothetical protein
MAKYHNVKVDVDGLYLDSQCLCAECLVREMGRILSQVKV